MFLGLLSTIASTSIQLPSDGHEYLATVTSLLATHNMTVEMADLEAAAASASPETFVGIPDPDPKKDISIGQNAKRSRQGEFMWGSHSFYIAVLALPFVALFGAKGFLVLNALCFVATLFLLYCHLLERNPHRVSFLLACACLLLSGAVNYVFWINSELILLALVSGALYFALRTYPLLGLVLLGLATAIKPPLVFLALPLLLWQLVQTRKPLRVLFVLLCFIAAGLPQLGYFYHYYGGTQARHHPKDFAEREKLRAEGKLPTLADLTPEQQALREARLKELPERSESIVVRRFEGWFKYISWERIWAFWYAPGTGLLWFYPAIFWCLLRNRWPWWLFSLLIGAALLMSFTSMVPVNLYSTQSGTRYAMFIVPVFFFLAGAWRGKALDWIGAALTMLLGGGLLLDATQNPREFEQLYRHTFPSMALVRNFGFTLYPEVLFQTGQRLDRDLATDFVDNQGYLRNEHTQFTARNVAPGNIIVRLNADSDFPGGAIAFRTPSQTLAAGALQAGRTTTIRVPVTEDDLMHISYPEYRFQRNDASPTVTVRARLHEMHPKLGSGELRWQTKHHAVEQFVYQAGPQLHALYPGEDWIVGTLASESLESSPADWNTQILATAPGVLVSEERDAIKEGDRALVLQNTNTTTPRIDLQLTPRFPLDGSPARYGFLECLGWLQSGPATPLPGATGAPACTLTINFFDQEGYFLHAVTLDKGRPDAAPEAEWRLLKKRVPVPEGAATCSLGLLFENTQTTLKLDDLVLSWFKDKWALAR